MKIHGCLGEWGSQVCWIFSHGVWYEIWVLIWFWDCELFKLNAYENDNQIDNIVKLKMPNLKWCMLEEEEEDYSYSKNPKRRKGNEYCSLALFAKEMKEK